MRLFSTVVEQMVLQNSISTNDFSHSVQGWSFSPVCISKCLPKVLELLNDFLHSVVQLCGFSSLSMNMCSFSFPVCVNDLLHCAQMWGFPQYEKAYECSGFQLGWMTFCILCTRAVSLHCGWAYVGLCDCGIVAHVAFVWILSSVYFGGVMFHPSLLASQPRRWHTGGLQPVWSSPCCRQAPRTFPWHWRCRRAPWRRPTATNPWRWRTATHP